MERRDFIEAAVGGTATLGLASGTGLAETGDLSLQEDPLDGIELKTDEYGVTHVYADTVYELGYGNGYVQARDRLFELDAVRHVSYGNSAEILGPAQLASDIQVKRDLYSREEIERQWEEAPDVLRETVRGFTDAVNRKMIERAASGELPAEFGALGHPPEPWQPEDSVAIINFLIGFFGVSGGSELGNAKTLKALQQSIQEREDVSAEEALERAFDAYEDLNWLEITDDHYTSIDERDRTVDGGETVPDSLDDVPEEQLDFLDAAPGAEMWGIETDIDLPEAVVEGRREAQGIMSGFKWGSNAIVVDGDLTDTGKPMLGGGPQTGYFKPPILYEVGLHGGGADGPEFDVTGVGTIGTPGIVIGRTENFAWTVTSGRDDQIDTIAIELHPEDHHRYRWNEDGPWREMECRTVTHVASPVAPALGGEADAKVVEQEVCRVNEADEEMPVVAWNPEENVAWVQRVTSRDDELDTSSLWAQLGTRDDMAGFEDQISEFEFTFNFHYIDDDGNIAYYHVGKVPERNPDLDHRLPAPASLHRWTGTRRGLGLGTHVRNPKRKYVVNWNNGPAPGWRAGDVEQNWGSIHRVDVLDRYARRALGLPDEAAVPDEAATFPDSANLSLQDVNEIVRKAGTHDSVAWATADVMAEAATDSDDPTVREMGEKLEAWGVDDYPWRDAEDGEEYTVDGDGGNDVYDDPGHVIWDVTRKKLQKRIFEDDIGDQAPDIVFEPPESSDPHAADHGRADREVTFADILNDRTESDYGWVSGDDGGDTSEAIDAAIVAAMEEAAKDLEEQFDSDEPDDWLLEEHKSKFVPLGATQPEFIDMVNRSSYNQLVAIGEGLREGDDPADTSKPLNSGTVLPPSNSGHITGPELVRAQTIGEEPDRLTDQLDLYTDWEYKPYPVTDEQVDAVAERTETIRADDPPLAEEVDRAVNVPYDFPNEVLAAMLHAARNESSGGDGGGSSGGDEGSDGDDGSDGGVDGDPIPDPPDSSAVPESPDASGS